METAANKVDYLVVDTTAFLQNAQLQEVGNNIVTVREVVDEITSKRQLRRLVVLPYDLIVKDVFPENIQTVTNFSKKTGDYPSLSATDIKVMALTYQLEKEFIGTEHLRTEPVIQKEIKITTSLKRDTDLNTNIPGFYVSDKTRPEASRSGSECEYEENVANNDQTIEKNREVNETETNSETLDNSKIKFDSGIEVGNNEDFIEKFKTLECAEQTNAKEIEIMNSILTPVKNNSAKVAHIEDKLDNEYEDEIDNAYEDEEDSEDEDSWITPTNIKIKMKKMDSKLVEEKPAKVACMTTDFAMQNVLKQMNLNVAALDGRMIKHLRTFILRCYTCFGTTSIMTKRFCPKCGNQTLKKVAVSLDANGKQQIHINGRKLLTARGKKFSLPAPQGGKHPQNPVLVDDQPMPDNRPSRLARTKNNPLDDNWIAGASPFIMRDVTSKSALLCIRPGQEMKHWMKKNPNEARRKKK